MSDRQRRIFSTLFDVLYYPTEAGLACAVFLALRHLVGLLGVRLTTHSAWAFAVLWLVGHMALNATIVRRQRRRARERVAYWMRSQVKSPYLPRQ